MLQLHQLVTYDNGLSQQPRSSMQPTSEWTLAGGGGGGGGGGGAAPGGSGGGGGAVVEKPSTVALPIVLAMVAA